MGYGGGKQHGKFRHCAPSVGQMFFKISAPEIDEITSPRLSSQHESLSAPLHPQLIFPHLSAMRSLLSYMKSAPMCLDASCFFTALSYLCLCLVSPLRHLCRVSLVRLPAAFFITVT